MTRQSIMGHSMGGHGALTIGLTLPDRFREVSAFSPIVAPGAVPCGQNAPAGYAGADKAACWRYHAVAKTEEGAGVPALILVRGAADPCTHCTIHPTQHRDTQ